VLCHPLKRQACLLVACAVELAGVACGTTITA
jgi:hypothetical protein